MSDLPSIPGYRIEREVGCGGMATVYLAVQESLERQVAIKVMARALGADPTFSERFVKEGRTIARLTHPHIVTVFDIGVADGYHYIAMEYVSGDNLKLRMRGGISTAQAVMVVRQVAAALGYAHDKGFVHRDVKPENILFRDNGDAVLTDFGIAKALGTDTRMTATGISIGTPSYMSPEQARGLPVDARSDLYSLGVMFYELLSGRRPFVSEDSFALAYKHINDPVPRLPEAQALFQPVIDTLLAKQPDARYANARLLINALERIERGETDDAGTVQATAPTEILTTPPAAAMAPTEALATPVAVPTAPAATPTPGGARAGATPVEGGVVSAPYRRSAAWVWWSVAAVLVALGTGVVVWYQDRAGAPAIVHAPLPEAAPARAEPEPGATGSAEPAVTTPPGDDGARRLATRWAALRELAASQPLHAARGLVALSAEGQGVMPPADLDSLRAFTRRLLDDSLSRELVAAPGGCDPSVGTPAEYASLWRDWSPHDEALARTLKAGIERCVTRAEESLAGRRVAEARTRLGHAATLADWLPVQGHGLLAASRYGQVLARADELDRSGESLARQREKAQQAQTAMAAAGAALGKGELSVADRKLAEARSLGAAPADLAPLERKLVDLGTRRRLAEELLAKARAALDAERLSEAQGHCEAARDFFSHRIEADKVCAEVKQRRAQVEQQWQKQNIGVMETERVR